MSSDQQGKSSSGIGIEEAAGLSDIMQAHVGEQGEEDIVNGGEVTGSVGWNMRVASS